MPFAFSPLNGREGERNRGRAALNFIHFLFLLRSVPLLFVYACHLPLPPLSHLSRPRIFVFHKCYLHIIKINKVPHLPPLLVSSRRSFFAASPLLALLSPLSFTPHLLIKNLLNHLFVRARDRANKGSRSCHLALLLALPPSPLLLSHQPSPPGLLHPLARALPSTFPPSLTSHLANRRTDTWRKGGRKSDSKVRRRKMKESAVRQCRYVCHPQGGGGKRRGRGGGGGGVGRRGKLIGRKLGY